MRRILSSFAFSILVTVSSGVGDPAHAREPLSDTQIRDTIVRESVALRLPL
jgi:hypothetical protein